MWNIGAILALCVVLTCAVQQVDKVPILKELPQEVLFRVPNNEDFNLSCVTVDKDVGVKYSWIKDGKPLLLRPDVTQVENEGTLVFKKTIPADEGKYRCLAQTSLGIASSRIINVKQTYIEKPAVTVQKHKPVNGRPYKLDCIIPKAYPKPEITWYVQNESLFNFPTYSKPGITISDKGTLYIASVNREHTKNQRYECYAETKAVDSPLLLAQHVLEDVVPDDGLKDNELFLQYVSKNATVKVRETLWMFCIYGGNPLPKSDWFKDGKNVNNTPQQRVGRYYDTLIYLIKFAFASDNGDYVCNIHNGVGQPQENTIHVNVISPPDFRKRGEPKIIVKAGQNVIIPCEVEAIPPASLSWTYNTKPLPQSVVQSESSITLKNVKKGDSGYYGCRAFNEHGDSYVESLVYVQ